MISRRILAAVALLCAFVCSAQAQPFTKSQLNAQVGVNFPDNTTFQITPLNVRTIADNIVNSIMPTAPVVSGNLACFNGTTGLLQDCGVAPSNNIVIGTTPITGGTNTRVLFDNAGVAGEYTNTQLTALINAATSTFSGALPAWPNNTSTALLGNGTYGAINLATGVAGLLPNANLATAGAATFKGNPTSSSATVQDFTIQGLVPRGAPDAVNDKIPLYDNAAGTIKYVTPGAVASSATSGVSSINGATGAFTTSNGVTSSGTVLQTDFTHNNTWTGDNFFKSGRPWVDVRAYGAVGDGTTDDTTAFNNAVAAAEAIGAPIYVSPSATAYCIKSGPVVLNNVGDVIFSTSRATTIAACGVDNTLIKLTNAYQSIYNLQFLGKGFAGDTSSFGAGNPVLLIQGTGGGCSDCIIDSVTVQGGANGLSISPASVNGEFFIYRSFFFNAYGAAIVYLKNSAGWLHRVKIDQAWPVLVPPQNTTLNAWAASTSYTRGQVVTLGGYMIQCAANGTSGGSSPSLKNYGNTISDNTTQWQLAGLVNGYALEIDTGSTEIYATDLDTTGATFFGVGMTNSLSGTAPNFFRCTSCVSSQQPSNGYNLISGNNVYLTNTNVAGGWLANTNAVVFNGAFSGEAAITGGKYGFGSAFGINMGTGGIYRVIGAEIQATTNDIVVAVSNVIAMGNFPIGGASVGISVSNSLAGIYVSGNICNGGAGTCVNSPTGLANSFIGNNF